MHRRMQLKVRRSSLRPGYRRPAKTMKGKGRRSAPPSIAILGRMLYAAGEGLVLGDGNAVILSAPSAADVGAPAFALGHAHK